MGESIARLEERVGNLEGWQRTQNGTLHRLEAKFDKLLFWLLAATVTFTSSLVVGLLLLLARRYP